MSKSSEAVKRWRENTKARLVEGMGGKCVICGYSKCKAALDFHHIDPNEKEFALGAARGSILNWEKLVEEVKKCALLCANCHREIHEGVAELPNELPTFLKEYEEYKAIRAESKFDVCSVCGKKKRRNVLACSPECSAIKRRKIRERPSKEQLLDELKTTSYVQVAKKYGVSDNAIRKWIK
jgi:hypothetical protein